MHHDAIIYHTLTLIDVGRQSTDEHLPREALGGLGALRLRRRPGRRAHLDVLPVAEATRLLRYVVVHARVVGFACKINRNGVGLMTGGTDGKYNVVVKCAVALLTVAATRLQQRQISAQVHVRIWVSVRIHVGTELRLEDCKQTPTISQMDEITHRKYQKQCAKVRSMERKRCCVLYQSSRRDINVQPYTCTPTGTR